jgi:Family of unknown function (DUF5803)
VEIKTKLFFIFLALMVVLVSGCIEEKKKITLDQPGNISSYEFEVFQDSWINKTPVNTSTYYILEDRRKVQVVNIVINCSKFDIYPPDTLGGNSEEKPIENFVLLVDPSKKTIANTGTLREISHKIENSSVNYTLTQEIGQNLKVIHLEFEEPFTGFIAYTHEIPGTQSFGFMKPDSEFIRVVLPAGYVTGNRVFGIALPTPYNVTFDEKARQNLLWNSSKMGKKEVAIQVKYYTKSAPVFFLATIVVLFIGVGLVLSHYFRIEKEFEAARGIFELEKECEEKQQRKK